MPSYKQIFPLLVSQGANHEESEMTQHALYVQLEAKPGKEQEVAILPLQRAFDGQR